MTKHTPGPWNWRLFGDRPALTTKHGGSIIVMDFIRKGMNAAQPRFGIKRTETDRGGLMQPAMEMDDFRTHPDARLIEAAPLLLEACKAAQDLLQRCDGERMRSDQKPATDADWDAVVKQIWVAITEAEG